MNLVGPYHPVPVPSCAGLHLPCFMRNAAGRIGSSCYAVLVRLGSPLRVGVRPDGGAASLSLRIFAVGGSSIPNALLVRKFDVSEIDLFSSAVSPLSFLSTRSLCMSGSTHCGDL